MIVVYAAANRPIIGSNIRFRVMLVRLAIAKATVISRSRSTEISMY